MHLFHQKKLLENLDRDAGHIVYLEGAKVANRYSTDFEYVFRQESNFWYLTGINEPDFHFILDLNTGDSHLFIPKRPLDYGVWHGKITPMQEYLEVYQPDHIHYDVDLKKVLSGLKPERVHCLNEYQAEPLLALDLDLDIQTDKLADAIARCREIKSPYEIEQTRKACDANSEAYKAMMRQVRPGMYEYEAMAIHKFENIKRGLQQEAYSGIFGAGTNASILHYTENNEIMRDGDLLLVDAGFECEGYASDYTRTFPVNGKFSDKQKAIYEIVLKAINDVIANMKPGVKYEDMHILAAEIIVEGLRDLGLLKGSTEDLMENNIFALFFPHGLGHFMGLDVHDVGGYLPDVPRIDRPGLKFLRTRRTLAEGQIFTVEPGLYFIPALLDEAFKDEKQAQFLNEDELRKYYDFGGIRIEDDVLITADGTENLTKVPKEVADIEAIMAEGK